MRRTRTSPRNAGWIISFSLVALGACDRSEGKSAPPPSTPAATKPAAAPTQAVKPPAPAAAAPTPAPTPPPPAAPAADPEAGNFTLEEATAELRGTGKLTARITTPQGQMTCELFDKDAPATVASFVGLARGLRPWKDPETGAWVKKPFFDGLAFHRVIPNFMIQGGDPQSRKYETPRLGAGDPGYKLNDEITPKFKFDVPGRLAMANAGRNTAGSQFFVTEVPYPSLDGGYTIFGQCDGVDVVKKITRLSRNAQDKPEQPVTMKVEILRK